MPAIDDLELARREQETRNEIFINALRLVLFSLVLSLHMLLHVLPDPPIVGLWSVDAFVAVQLVICAALHVYLRANPPYAVARKYLFSTFELLIVVAVFALQRSVLPPFLYGLAPLGPLLLVTIISALRYSTSNVILTGMLALIFQVGLFASTLPAPMRAPVLASNISLITLVTAVLAYVVRNLLDFNREVVMKQRLSRFLAPEMVDEIAARPELLAKSVEQREATVLFTDIRGFSTLSEHMPPEQVVAFLNEFLEEMTEAVMAHGGMLDKYIGDAVMAVFGVPGDHPQHALQAVEAALEMRRRLHDLNVRAAERGLPRLGLGVGIHTGVLVVGAIGSTRRLDYTVIGDTVNVASRLEALTRQHPTDVLLSEASRRAIGDAVGMRDMGTVPVKGRAEAVRIYAPEEALHASTAQAPGAT